MRECIAVYLDLARATNGITNVNADQVRRLAEKAIVLAGINSPLDPTAVSPVDVVSEWHRMHAVPFDVEAAVTRECTWLSVSASIN